MHPSFQHIPHMNPWAVLVTGIILWFLGAIWYSPALFSKQWMAALGIVPDSSKKGLATGMISSLVGDWILSFVLLHFILWSGADSFGMGAFVGFISWLGFLVATQYPQGIYERRPISLFWINSGYWFFGLMIAGGVLAIWR